MNPEAPPWIAEFRFSVVLDFFPCRFPGLWRAVSYYFLTFSEFSGWGVFCSVFFWIILWAGLGMVFAYFVPRTPPVLCRGWSG